MPTVAPSVVVLSGPRHPARGAGRQPYDDAMADTGERLAAYTVVAAQFALFGVILAPRRGARPPAPTRVAAGVAIGAGAVVAAAGLPYAFAGGAWLLTPSGAGFLGFGAAGLLLGSAVLLAASVLGHTGVAGLPRLFTAGVAAGLTGLLAALLDLAGISAAGSAAVALTVAIGMLPSYPIVASWIGRLPFPELPNRAEDILKDKTMPKRADVFSAVVRAGEVLTGLLLAAALTSIVAITYLMATARSTAGVLLVVAAVAALLLRARLLPTPQQRVPLLVAGLGGLAVLGGTAVVTGDSASSGLTVLAAAAVVAGIALTAGLVFARRAPTPYLGRAADILDVLAIMALIPLACAVIGIFESIRGMFASIGG